MDRTTARSLVASKVEDPDQTRFSSTQYNNAIDMANQQICIDGRALIESTAVTLVAGQSTYSLPSDFLVMIMVRCAGLKLAPTTKYELSFQSGQDWTQLPNGTPTMTYMDEQNGKFGLVPAPDSTAVAATNACTLDYIGIPAALSSDSSALLGNVTILQYYAHAVVAWAAAEVLTYAPITPEISIKRDLLLKDYERYKNQLITTYLNMVNEPLRMSGGQNWQDQHIVQSSNAFSDN